jgi:Ca2+-binding RTX toxin-like protein
MQKLQSRHSADFSRSSLTICFDRDNDDTLTASSGEGFDGRMYGGSGDDELKGGCGDNDLFGGSGDDTLTGGDCSEPNHFDCGPGIDTITNFDAGQGDTKTGDCEHF